MIWENNNLKLGKVIVGVVEYDAFVSKSDTKKYRASTRLPDLSDYRGHFPTAEQARAKVEKDVKAWLHWANLEEKDHA